jgi:hypothetical protein
VTTLEMRGTTMAEPRPGRWGLEDVDLRCIPSTDPELSVIARGVLSTIDEVGAPERLASRVQLVLRRWYPAATVVIDAAPTGDGAPVWIVHRDGRRLG